MGIFLGQLPPAEVARLKAELAETLIANFCYPRFFDYRTESLRMRPVDRTKRQEVWLYLNSVDFSAWGRVDLMSPDFQYHIERLFIYFVQRNRSFFGEQGRKRMGDIRMLISSSASSLVEGLRGHLTGHHQSNPPFGSPRPVNSWSTTNASNRSEPGWDQIVASTMLLQQQLQEVRGEIKMSPAAPVETRPAAAGQRTTRRSTGTASTRVEREREMREVPPSPPLQSIQAVQPAQPLQSMQSIQAAQSAPVKKSAPQSEVRTPPAPGPKSISPLNPTSTSAPIPPSASAAAAIAPVSTPAPISIPASPAASPTPAPVPDGRIHSPSTTPTRKVDPPIVQTPEAPVVQRVPQTATPAQSPATAAPELPVSERVEARTVPTAPPQARELAPTQGKPLPATSVQSTTALVSDEDVAIFEQMRHKLVVWLRIEAVRSGLDISNQGPSQLLELLRQLGNFDETRLQIVSTLLDLANQVSKNRQATLLDYKQGLLFYLM